MFTRNLSIAVLIGVLASRVLSDDVLYRYEGDVLPYDPSAGWMIYNPCEDECNEVLEDGHFVLQWVDGTDLVNYNHIIAQSPTPPPPSLWVEWRFRSTQPFGGVQYTCDGWFSVKYGGMFDGVFMFGDAAISYEGGDVVTGLDIDEFQTYRYESLDGINYHISVDGLVFMLDAEDNPEGYHRLQFSGNGGCSMELLPTFNEWDYIRYGTISLDDLVIASDPPSGYLDPAIYSDLDRFTVTFDSANYVYIDDITVEVSGGIAPAVIQTCRRETDDVETVEIVLDGPLDTNELTRFTYDDGEATSVIEYWFDATVSGACCTSDGSCLDLTADGCAAIAGAVYRGDGTSCQGDNNSDGHDDACDDLFPIIPTVSTWGLIILTLLTVATAAVILSRKSVPRS